MANDTESTPPGLYDETAPQVEEVGESEFFVVAFSSSNHDGEMEAMAVKGVLDANGIPAIMAGPHVLPSMEFQVQVPESLLETAKQVIRDARQDGRRAADEAERAGE